jgi:hypothetical protein
MGEVFTVFWFGGPKGRNRWEDQGVDGKDNIKMGLREIRTDGMK